MIETYNSIENKFVHTPFQFQSISQRSHSRIFISTTINGLFTKLNIQSKKEKNEHIVDFLNNADHRVFFLLLFFDCLVLYAHCLSISYNQTKLTKTNSKNRNTKKKT